MTGRYVPEWIGSTPDAAIPKRVRLRVFERDAGTCQLTGQKLRPGDAWDLDHKTALSMGGEHREANLQVVSRDAHKTKTRQDVADLAKARRIALKHSGGWPAAKRKIASRPFPKRAP